MTCVSGSLSFLSINFKLSQHRNYRWRKSLEKLFIILQIESCDKSLFVTSTAFEHTPNLVHILVSYSYCPYTSSLPIVLLAIINKTCSHLNCIAKSVNRCPQTMLFQAMGRFKSYHRDYPYRATSLARPVVKFLATSCCKLSVS